MIRGIKFVADNGETRLREVHTNLMRASGEWMRLDQGIFRAGLQHLESGFSLLAVALVHHHPAMRFRLRCEFEAAGPFRLLRHAVNDGEINFFHLPAFKQIADGIHAAETFGAEQNAGGLRVEAMDEAEEFQITRARPVIARRNRGHQRRLQVAIRLLPGKRDKHPAARLVNGDDGTILVKNRDDFTRRQFNVFWLGHAERLNELRAVQNENQRKPLRFIPLPNPGRDGGREMIGRGIKKEFGWVRGFNLLPGERLHGKYQRRPADGPRF